VSQQQNKTKQAATTNHIHGGAWKLEQTSGEDAKSYVPFPTLQL